jgi:hypothetical protein
MRIPLHLLLTVIILTVAVPMIMLGQSRAKQTEELIRRSDVIVVGTVGKLASEWSEDKSMILTRVTLSIDETIKGEPGGRTFTVVIPGGEVDGVGEWYSHSARFTEQEDVVVFAERDGRGRFRVAGGEEGKVLVTRDENTGQMIIPNFGTLDQLTTQIRNTVKQQKT